MKLKYEIVEVTKITEFQKHEMFRLMELHYANMYWDNFIKDLSEKQWVIMLSTCDEVLVGFSTQILIVPDSNSKFENCLVLYSGDTIIKHDYWGSTTLPVAFLQLVSKIQVEFPNKKIYWMLISKGLRTYKFLSVFLNEYYPCHFAETPAFIKDLMLAMGIKKFSKKFEPEKGIIKADNNGQYLKETYQPNEKTENPVACFFYTCNPGYHKGDELLCMAELTESNYHPFIKRMISNYA